jgi:transposase
VPELLCLSWDQVQAIMQRAVERRQAEPVPHIGVDEKSSRQRQCYFTLVNDLEPKRVLYAAEGRRRQSLDGFWPTLSDEQRREIQAVAMDMWAPYAASVREHVPLSGSRIVLDKFHIAQDLARARDQVRREENKRLKQVGDER